MACSSSRPSRKNSRSDFLGEPPECSKRRRKEMAESSSLQQRESERRNVDEPSG
ncbi:hypothetical protein SRHO_G00027450 [Serrasalmus rhombeus]